MNYIVIHVLYKYIMVVEGKIIIIDVYLIIMVGGSITAKGIFRVSGRVRSFRMKYKGKCYITICICIYLYTVYIHTYVIYINIYSRIKAYTIYNIYTGFLIVITFLYTVIIQLL